MLKNYLKITLAVFRRRKFFTFVNLFGITFTLAILLVGVTILDNLFGAIPPEVHQDRTLCIYRVNTLFERDDGSYGGGSSGASSYNLLDKYMPNLPGVEKTAVVDFPWKILSYANNQRIESFLKHTDANFWEIMEFDFIEGRPFSHDEYDNADFVAVINESTREKFFGSDSAYGKQINANGQHYRVTGVVKDVPFQRMTPFADIWIPLSLEKDLVKFNEYTGFYTGIILAKDKKYFPQIREEFVSRIETIDLEGTKVGKVIAIPETMFEMASRMIFNMGKSEESSTFGLLLVIIVLSVLFMVLPTVNMVNLNISRIMERAGEIGVRKAFGAPSLTLVGQFITESILLSLAGGALSLLIGFTLLQIISVSDWIPYAQFSINFRIFFYALIITLFFGVFSGVYPAWRMSRMHPVDALRGGV
ncbi:MAG: ABC transporter permease [Candidatus Electryonea clarkiae]|nr:ABC transporter permease [Candidatus Electryonea clarkiae]MDP8286006.1 ABC transporter permease [Candidatus Electryonea clarkiae]